MPKVSFIAVNGSGGAYVSIPSTIYARRVEIIEDESVTPQGLTVEFPADAYTQVYTFGPSTEPLVIGNVVAHGNNQGSAEGTPGVNVPTDTYAGGTTYEVGDTTLSGAIAWVCIKAGTIGIAPALGANWALLSNYRPADVYCKVRSLSAAATKVRVVEFE